MQSREELIAKIKQEQPSISDEELQRIVKYLQQLKGCRLFSTVSQDINEDRWLQARTAGIGGSDIASIMNRNPWSSPRQIWMSKTNQFAAEGNFQSEAARWGNVLETAIANEWAFRERRDWVHIPVTLQSIEEPWMLANIDGFILDDDDNITGILEIKTTNEHNRSVWENGPLPEYYLCQANWYATITGQDNFVLVCLVGGQSLYAYELPVNPVLVKEMREAAKEFWLVNVQQMVEPPATEGDIEAFKAAFSETEVDDIEEPALIIDDEESDRVAVAYVQIRDKIRELTKIQKDLQAALYDMLQGRTQALTLSHTLQIGKSNRRKCNYDILEEKYPEAYRECIEHTVITSLRIK